MKAHGRQTSSRFIERNREVFDRHHGPISWASDDAAVVRSRRSILDDDLDDLPTDQSILALAADGQRYDQARRQLLKVLEPYSLIGYHCTRLTEGEIASIYDLGMEPPTVCMLQGRIYHLVCERLIDAPTAEILFADNDADKPHLSGRIYFCFFPPRRDSGLEDFFRYWGGEALLRPQRTNPAKSQISELLTRIGVPCIIEAIVPVKSLVDDSNLVDSMARQYFLNRFDTNQRSENFSGFVPTPIPAGSIRQIIRHPSPEFSELTGCDNWRPKLTTNDGDIESTAERRSRRTRSAAILDAHEEMDRSMLDLEEREGLHKAILKCETALIGYFPSKALPFVMRNYRQLAALGILEVNWMPAYTHASHLNDYPLSLVREVFEACDRRILQQHYPISAGDKDFGETRYSLFRGCAGPQHRMGMSWTVSLDKAIWYAAKHAASQNLTNVAVYAAVGDRSEIYCCGDHYDRDYIVLPKEWWKIDVPIDEFKLDRSR
jgi:hypothetical protein